jgi:hypothetical protein
MILMQWGNKRKLPCLESCREQLFDCLPIHTTYKRFRNGIIGAAVSTPSLVLRERVRRAQRTLADTRARYWFGQIFDLTELADSTLIFGKNEG